MFRYYRLKSFILRPFYFSDLTAEVSKGKAIIQEIKRTCNQGSARLNGPEYIETHNEQHLKDIQGVLEVSISWPPHPPPLQKTNGGRGAHIGIMPPLWAYHGWLYVLFLFVFSVPNNYYWIYFEDVVKIKCPIWQNWK